MGCNESKFGANKEHGKPQSTLTKTYNGYYSEMKSIDPYNTDERDYECVCHNPFEVFNRNRSRNRSNSRNKPFGTPIPDTPELLRKRRKEEAERGNYAFLDLEKSSDNYTTCEYSSDEMINNSKSGSCKEIQDARKFHFNDPYQSDHQSKSNGILLEKKPDGEHTNANVHEGKKAEQELYEKYDICDVLGVGSTSTCYRCINRTTGEPFACKIIDKQHIQKYHKGMSDQLFAEILTLKSLHHPNIVTLYDVYITENKIYIVMELMEGGELFDYVVKKGTLTEDEASEIVRKVVSALVYLHQQNIVHRDLKPENLMLSREPLSPLDLQVKIIDFGLSKNLSNSSLATSFLGTRGYLAPEMLQRRDYSRAIDAWALGVIVYVLLCGCLPFDDESLAIIPRDDYILSQKFRLRFPRWANNLSPSARDLLSHLLDIDARTRYTAEQALRHPWVTGIDIPKNNYLHSPGRIYSLPKHLMNNSINQNGHKETLINPSNKVLSEIALANEMNDDGERSHGVPSKGYTNGVMGAVAYGMEGDRKVARTHFREKSI